MNLLYTVGNASNTIYFNHSVTLKLPLGYQGFEPLADAEPYTITLTRLMCRTILIYIAFHASPLNAPVLKYVCKKVFYKYRMLLRAEHNIATVKNYETTLSFLFILHLV